MSRALFGLKTLATYAKTYGRLIVPHEIAVDIIAKPSGAMSLDLQAKKGHEIVQSLRRALALDPGETA